MFGVLLTFYTCFPADVFEVIKFFHVKTQVPLTLPYPSSLSLAVCSLTKGSKPLDNG